MNNMETPMNDVEIPFWRVVIQIRDEQDALHVRDLRLYGSTASAAVDDALRTVILPPNWIAATAWAVRNEHCADNVLERTPDWRRTTPWGR